MRSFELSAQILEPLRIMRLSVSRVLRSTTGAYFLLFLKANALYNSWQEIQLSFISQTCCRDISTGLDQLTRFQP